MSTFGPCPRPPLAEEGLGRGARRAAPGFAEGTGRGTRSLWAGLPVRRPGVCFPHITAASVFPAQGAQSSGARAPSPSDQGVWVEGWTLRPLWAFLSPPTPGRARGCMWIWPGHKSWGPPASPWGRGPTPLALPCGLRQRDLCGVFVFVRAGGCPPTPGTENRGTWNPSLAKINTCTAQF